MSGVGTIPGCPQYPGILSIQGSRASCVRNILVCPQYPRILSIQVSGQSRDVLSIPGYIVFKDPGHLVPGILSIQGSRDPGRLVSGQSRDVLSIPGYLVFKDPGIQGIWCRDNPGMSLVSRDT